MQAGGQVRLAAANSALVKGALAIGLIFCIAQALFLSADYARHGRIGLEFTWDAAWYQSIMDGGYRLPDPTYKLQQNVVFFPLYPLAVKVVQQLTHLPNNLCMYATSSILLLATLGFLAALLLHFYPPRIAYAAVALFALNPFAIYFLNGYSEALWAFLLVAFCYLLIVRHNYPAAALALGLASATRPYGVLLIPIYFFELANFESGRSGRGLLRALLAQWRHVLLLPVMVSGLLAYMIYLWAAFGDPLAFVHGQQAWDAVSDRTLWKVISPGKLLGPVLGFARGTFDTPSVVLGCLLYGWNVLLTVAYARKLPRVFTLFNALFLLFFYLALNHFGSVGRFMTICFPSSLALALLIAGDHPLGSGATCRTRASEGAAYRRLYSRVALGVVLLACCWAYYRLAVLFFDFQWVA